MSDASITLPDVVNTAQTPQTLTPLVTPYARRRITLAFTFGSSPAQSSTSVSRPSEGTTLTLTNMRIWCQIENNVSPSGATSAIVRVYGLTLSHINQLTLAGVLFGTPNDTVTISAGDDTSTQEVFTGLINEAKPDFSNQPNAGFIITAITSTSLRTKPTAPISYPGSVSAADALQAICKQAGMTLRNQGVTAQIASPYFWGTTWQQIMRAASAADAYAFYDSASNTLVVWPKNSTSAPNQTNPVLIGPQTGMINYPEFQKATIRVRNVFSSGLQAIKPGTWIKVQSQLAAANGTWAVKRSTLLLSSRLPRGPWEIVVEATSSTLPGG